MGKDTFDLEISIDKHALLFYKVRSKILKDMRAFNNYDD